MKYVNSDLVSDIRDIGLKRNWWIDHDNPTHTQCGITHIISVHYECIIMYRFGIRDYHSCSLSKNIEHLDKYLLEIIRHDLGKEKLTEYREHNCKIALYSVKEFDVKNMSNGRTIPKYEERVYDI